MERLFNSSVVSILTICIIFQLGLIKSEYIMECHGHNITFTEDIMDRYSKCYTTRDDLCFLKCLLFEADQLGQAGEPIKEKIIMDLQKEILIHDSHTDLFWTGFGNCLNDHAWKIPTEAEPNCTSYSSLDTCWHKLYVEVCHGI